MVHEDALFAVPPGRIRPSGGAGHMSVFAAYYRRWRTEPRRDPLLAPGHIALPDAVARGRVPSARGICPGPVAPRLPQGGESAGRARLAAWLRTAARGYDEVHDDLAADATSRLSPYLHFGCLSPVEIPSARQSVYRGGVSCAAGGLARLPRSRSSPPDQTSTAVELPDRAVTGGCTRPTSSRPAGRDAPAPRLSTPACGSWAAEGWLHNRARLIVAHFLTKTLYLDWRLGAAHFADLLVDGDVAEQHPELAVGRRHRHRLPVQPHSTTPSGQALPLRPGRKLRAPPRARAARHPRPGCARAVAAA